MADENTQLPIKNIPSRIKLWKVVPYKDSTIFIRQIDNDLFEYLAMWNGKLYTDNIVITPEPGQEKLTNQQEHTCFAYIFAAATTTIDTLRGEGLTEAQQQQTQGVIDVIEVVEKKKGLVN